MYLSRALLKEHYERKYTTNDSITGSEGEIGDAYPVAEFR